jgi:hypothetical protein
MFFILTLLSSLSAAIFVNININLASAKISSHSSVGDSNDTSNGDIVSSKGSNGDGGGSSSSSNGRTTTTPSKDQGNTDLSATNLAGTLNNGSPLTLQQQQPDSSNCNTTLMVNCGSFKPNNTSSTTTTTPTTQQQQPDSSNCNTKLMIGCVNGSSVQCIVAPCGPSSTTSTNAGNSINGSVTGSSVQCIVAPCGPSSTTSTDGSPLTPQQQYQQCASGIGGGIPGNCKPPSSTTTSEQNFAPQTLTPPKCELLPTDANGNCQRINMQDGSSGLPPPPQLGSQEKQAHFNLPDDVIVVKQLPDGSCPADYIKMKYELPTGNCMIKLYPKNPDGSCPLGLVMITQAPFDCVHMPVLPGTSTGSTGGGFIQMFPTPPATSPPATSPNNTSPYLPPPVVK